jgi:hypothetical protein
MRPAKLVRRVYTRGTRACHCAKTIVSAPPPERFGKRSTTRVSWLISSPASAATRCPLHGRPSRCAVKRACKSRHAQPRDPASWTGTGFLGAAHPRPHRESDIVLGDEDLFASRTKTARGTSDLRQRRPHRLRIQLQSQRRDTKEGPGRHERHARRRWIHRLQRRHEARSSSALAATRIHDASSVMRSTG